MFGPSSLYSKDNTIGVIDKISKHKLLNTVEYYHYYFYFNKVLRD